MIDFNLLSRLTRRVNHIRVVIVAVFLYIALSNASANPELNLERCRFLPEKLLDYNNPQNPLGLKVSNFDRYYTFQVFNSLTDQSLVASLQSRNPTRIRYIAKAPFDKLPYIKNGAITDIDKNRLIIAGSGITLTNLSLYRCFKNIWWSHNRTGFHFYRGWRRTTGWWDLGPNDSLWFHMDKLGHLYNARLVSKTMAELGTWVGLTQTQSTWTGAILSSLFYLEIEIFDGHYQEWGFSIGDFLASEAGAFLPILNQHFPVSNNFTLKWSYRCSPEINNEQYFIEDYAGMTFWLSADVDNLLPKGVQGFWPNWLNIALGYGITQKAYGDIELYLAFDYNLTKIPFANPTIRKLLGYINYIHFPTPTLQFRPMLKYHWQYF